MKRQRLRQEANELLLVAAGAIPGALLRWCLELSASPSEHAPSGLVGADLVANLLGCLLIGALAAQPPARSRLFLFAGIGFCGSLTTFSGWILELQRQLLHGQALLTLVELTLVLSASLLLAALGYGLARRFGRHSR